VAQIATADILRLAAARFVGIEDRIERLYLWQFDRLMAAVKGAFVIAASLLAPLATVFFEGSVQAQWWWVLLLLTGLVAVGAFGFFSYRRLGQIYWAYLDNLLMLGFARQTTEVGS
jgi:hypothetical protein